MSATTSWHAKYALRTVLAKPVVIGADSFELNDSETQNDHVDDVSALDQIYGKDDDDYDICEDWHDEVGNWIYKRIKYCT